MTNARIVLMMGISLDGIVAVPSGSGLRPVMEGTAGLPAEDPELTRAKMTWLWETGVHIMGRATYQEMAGFWPSSTADYAAPMNELPKVVFSKTLADEDADWPESRVARGDLAEEIDRLRRESGKDVVAYGGASFAQSLARHNLVDEYRLVTHPVAVGEGARLFDGLPEPVHLRHVETRPFATAAVHIYAR
jgi:dihydrofolate reductase